MTSTVFIGIDPGQSGGICAIEVDDDTEEICRTTLMKGHQENRSCIIDWLHNDLRYHLRERIVCYTEQVNGIPYNPQTGAQQSVQQNFKFGLYTGVVLGLFYANDIEPIEVAPIKWQRKIGIKHNKGELKTDKKNRHKQLAEELFGQKFTHWSADAALIAYYGVLVRSENVNSGITS